MRIGDVVPVVDGKTGREYEAVARFQVGEHTWQMEWSSGPDDGEHVVVDLEDEQ
jgi:hypothetical protein